jgi:Tfp pilus assembly protein PilF
MTKIGTAVSIILCWLWLALAAMPVDAQPSDTQRRWEMLNTEIVQAYRSGDFAEGIGKAEQALALAHDAFGPRHPDTLQSMNTLAFLYRSQGRHGEAEPLHREALETAR